MNLAQTIDLETLRTRAPERSMFSEIAAIFVDLADRMPKRVSPKESTRETLKPGSTRAAIYDLIEENGTPMTYPEIRDALAKKIGNACVKTTIFNMVESKILVRNGFCKSYRYGIRK